MTFDPVAVLPGELRAWLEERVGPLARFEVDPAEPPRPPASPPPAREHERNEPEKAPAASGGDEQLWRRTARNRRLAKLDECLAVSLARDVLALAEGVA